jgi:hypothetical protein
MCEENELCSCALYLCTHALSALILFIINTQPTMEFNSLCFRSRRSKARIIFRMAFDERGISARCRNVLFDERLGANFTHELHHGSRNERVVK